MAKKRANGEGNIRKRKDRCWEGRYTAGYDEKTGKRIIKSVLGKTQAEVKEKLAKAVAEAETVDVRRADEYTLGTWLQTWYELYAKPHLRFSTAEYYRRGIELHIVPRIGDIPLKKLTGRDLQWLYKDLQEHGRLREAQKGRQPGLSDSTIRGIHTMLHNALDRAVKERLIVRNPADDCIPPKIPKHEMRILPPEQIKSYLTAADQRGVLPMFYLELISGLRKGELVALQWSDLDIENKTISVSKQAGRNNAGEPDITRPKTENSIRKISIPQDAVDLLVGRYHPLSHLMTMCMGLNKREFAGHVVCEHAGGLHGVSSKGALLLGEGYGFAVLCNQGDEDMDALLYGMLCAVMGLPLATNMDWFTPAGRDFSAPHMIRGRYIGHEGVPSILCIHCEEDGSHLRGTRDGEDLRLVYCGGARFLAVKPDAPDTVVCHLEFLIRAGRAWGVRVGTRVFERD